MDSEKINNLRVASFSAYLSTPEESFVAKLTESVQHTSPAITPSQETPGPVNLKRIKTQEGEISVFGAERYFNMKLDDESQRIIDCNAVRNGHKKENQVDLHRMRPKSRPGTPSVRSETSSNSQIALLPSFVRNPSPNKQKKVNEKWFFAGLRCNGSCSDKKASYIDPNVAHGAVHGKEYSKEAMRIDHNPVIFSGRKQSQQRFQVKEEIHCPSFKKMNTGSNTEEEYIAVPIMNSGVQNLSVQRRLVKDKTKEEEPRISLEVFGSNMSKKGDIAMNLERKLSMLTWDAIPNAPSIPSTSFKSQMYEDVESDASSDLFEIENLSCSGQPLFTRQASDGMSSCVTPYAPSETSIEWSVVTASAADFSFVSDYDGKKLAENIITPGLTTTSTVGKTKPTMDKEVLKGRPSGLLGCKSHKAVRVAETAYRSDVKAKPHQLQPQRSVVNMPVRKLQAVAEAKDFDFP